MTDKATLEGACSCGRNEYIIIAPTSLSETISVIFDERAEHGQSALTRPFASCLHQPSVQRALFRSAFHCPTFEVQPMRSTQAKPMRKSAESLLRRTHVIQSATFVDFAVIH